MVKRVSTCSLGTRLVTKSHYPLETPERKKRELYILEAKILLVHILRSYKLLPGTNLSLYTLPESIVSFTLRPKHALNVVLESRQP